VYEKLKAFLEYHICKVNSDKNIKIKQMKNKYTCISSSAASQVSNAFVTHSIFQHLKQGKFILLLYIIYFYFNYHK